MGCIQGRDRALRGQWARANLSQHDHGCPGTGGHGHHLGLGAPAAQKRSSFELPSSPAPVSRHFLSLVLSPLPAIFLLPLCPSFLSFSLSFLYVALSLDVGLSAVSASLRSVSRCLSLPSGSLSLSGRLTLSPAVTSTSVGPRLLYNAFPVLPCSVLVSPSVSLCHLQSLIFSLSLSHAPPFQVTKGPAGCSGQCHALQPSLTHLW